jgi:thiol-disulfide isomerase/thioredoxin
MQPVTVRLFCAIVISSAILAQRQAALAAGEADRLAAAVVKSHARSYGALQTYYEEAVLAFDFQGRVGGVDLSQRSRTTPLRFVFVRGKGFCLESTDTALYAVNGSLTLYRPVQAQYQLRSIKAEPTLDDVLQAVDPEFRMVRWHPALIGILGAGDTPQTRIPDIAQWQSVARGKLGTRDVWQVQALAGKPGPSGEGLPLQIRLDAQTFQVVRIVLDLSSTVQSQAAKLRGGAAAGTDPPVKATVTFSVLKSARNEPIEDSRLRFMPAEGDRQVDRFELTAPELIGNRAPQIEGPTLAGKPFSLESQRGRLVLVDFWGTWCAPCVAHLPHLQKLSAEFQNDLVVVGVNADNAEQSDQIRRLVESQRITFPQILDPQGSNRRRFRVGGFPCLVLIDRQGIVRDMFPAPSRLSDLRGRIRELLEAAK